MKLTRKRVYYMKTKKLVAAVIAVGVLALTPMHVFATKTQVAHTDSKTFTSIDDAWKEASNGSIVYLDSDWNLDSRLVLSSNTSATLELNGHKISRGLTSSKTNGEVIKLSEGSNLTLTGNAASSDFYFKGYNRKGNTEDEMLTAGGMITGGYSTNGGGAIHMKEGSTLNIDGVDICGNNSEQSWGSDGHGGAIYVDGDKGVLNINNSYIGFNYAEERGGAIYVDDKEVTINLTNSTIGFNTSGQNNGGAFYFNDESPIMNVENSTITNNYADEKGGAMYFTSDVYHSKINMKNSHVDYNVAGNNDGGAIYMNGVDIEVTLDGGTLDHNTAKGSGGAAYFNNFHNIIFLENGATANYNEAKTGSGGLVYINYTWGNAVTSNTYGNVQYNKALSGSGGAIYTARDRIWSNETIIKGLTFIGNEAENGGAIDAHSENVYIYSCSFKENKAKIGSAIFVNNDDFRICSSTTITGNIATDASSGAVQTSALNDIKFFGSDVIIQDNYNEASQTYRNLVLGESLTCNSYVINGSSGNSSIGVSVGSARVIGTQIYNECFKSDSFSYRIEYTHDDSVFSYKTGKLVPNTIMFNGNTQTSDNIESSESTESNESTDTTTEENSEAESSELVESIQHIVTVNFEDNNGWKDSDQISYVESDDAKVSPPLIEGKTFKEWKNLPEGATVEEDNTVNLGKLKEDVEITCVFTEDEVEDSSATASIFGSGNSTTVILVIVVACVCSAGGYFVGKKSRKKE